MPQDRSKTSSGFTLIEMIVSLAIFSIIITMSIGALLTLISSNERLQGEQSVMNNLAFALDSMTRELRTGYNYYCEERGVTAPGTIFAGDNHEDLGEATQDCSGGRNSSDPSTVRQGVSFFEGGNSIIGTTGTPRRILYFYDGAEKTIKRRVGDSDAQAVISSGLQITDAEFIVTGSEPFSVLSEREQPTVTVFLEAVEVGDTTGKKYRIQTTVTQRILDL